MSHTAGIPGFGSPWTQQYGPYGQYGQSPLAQLWGANTWGAVNPLAQSLGFSHSSGEGIDPTRQLLAQWVMQQQQQQQQIDPFYGMRVAQTFPFAQWPTSPVG